MDRLTKWDPDHGWVENHDNDTREWKNGSRACMEKLGRLEDAQEQGRLLELPCRIGDSFYFVSDDLKIIERKVSQLLIRENGNVEITSDIASCGWELGVNCFPDRATAEIEAALAAKEGEAP